MYEFDSYRPGALAGVVGLHADYYAKRWGFGLPFETKVAGELAAFLQHMDASRDLFLTAYDAEGLAGSITLDVGGGGADGAHLRWFIVAERTQGKGLGAVLMEHAMNACDGSGHRAWLTTFAGLDQARRLYERHDFRLTQETGIDQWQGGVREQRFERPARPTGSLS